jgi:hypothetical protein
LFWLKLININDINIFNILTYSIYNLDTRIFKLLLSYYNNYISDDKTIQYIEDIITNLVKNNMKIKHKMNRLKLLSNYFNLKPFFKLMIYRIKDLSFINKLMKYYYDEQFDFDTLNDIFKKSDCINDLLDFYLKLKTVNEQYIFVIIAFLNEIHFENPKLYKFDYMILKENYYNILSIIDKNKSLLSNEFINKIFVYLLSNNYVMNYLDIAGNHKNNLFKYTRFYVKFNNLYNIKINRCLHFLRCVMKKKYNKKYACLKFLFQPVLHELLYYKRYNQNTNNTHLLILKPNGINCKLLPCEIFPECEISNYEINAVFLEKHNLYLIYDINIPNTTFIERQYILREMHINNKSIPKVNNINEFYNELQNENNLINKFLTLPYKIKWYPIGIIISNIDENLYKYLTNYINYYNMELLIL